MGFFEDLGELMKKYDFEIHTFNLEENIKIMNQRLHLALTKEDLPPPVILLKTKEGNFIPSVFGPISINNNEKNVKFLNVDNNTFVDLFPVEEPFQLEQEVIEEGSKEEEQTVSNEEAQVVDVLNKLAEKMQNDSMNWETVTPTEKKEEPKVEEIKEQVKVEEAPKKRGRKAKKAEQIDMGEVEMEEIKPKYVYNAEDKFFIIGPMFKKEKCNMDAFLTFLNANEAKLKLYNSAVNCFEQMVSPEVFEKGNIKGSSKEGKELIEQLEKKIDGFDVVICLKGWEKATEAKKLVEYAKSKGKTIVEENDF